MMKKLLAVAVALCVAVPSTFAAWDYFPIIEQGSVEANINSDGGIKIRYGLMDNLEIFSANWAENDAEYTIGARYQIVPEMFSAYADLGIPGWNQDGRDWGLTPGVQFSTNFTETIALGFGLGLPLHINHPGWGDTTTADNPYQDGFGLDLIAGLEVDFTISEQVLFWVGLDFEYRNLTNAGFPKDYKREFDAADALSPAIGLTFSKDNLSVGTSLGIGFDFLTDKEAAKPEADQKTTIGFRGGVDFGIKF